jgi:hypothetical protein
VIDELGGENDRMERQRISGRNSKALTRAVAALLCAAPVLATGCSMAITVDQWIRLAASEVVDRRGLPAAGAAVVTGRLEHPQDEDYIQFVVSGKHEAVTVMTAGYSADPAAHTDTAGQIETADGTPITESCDRDQPRAPCVFSYHADSPETPPNFVWAGKLSAGTYYARVTAERGSSGHYELRSATWDAAPEPPLAAEPTLLVISEQAATGPDYAAEGSIDAAGQADYYKLVLNQTYNTVTIMTSGPTDTAGQVETELRTAITRICDGERPDATAPCVWGSDANIQTPDPQRAAKYNTMAASTNFIWEGKLATGVYFIRVTGESGATGAYQLTVEVANISCPVTAEDPHGYYCED